MESHIQKLTDLLEQWKAEVVKEGGENPETVMTSITNSDTRAHAKDLATLTVVAAIKAAIQTRARKSQALMVESRLQAQAEIVEGYPRAMYHLCVPQTDEM